MAATPSERSLQLRITGRVQGVGYRAWALGEARRLGLRGWVRNRRDGSVEALVTGDENSVEAMIMACRGGPRLARVEEVTVGEADDGGSLDFRPLTTV